MATLSGGAWLEAALEEMSSRVSNPGTLRVGFLEGATYPDGTSVALVAAVQNFGGGSVPPRPFFSNMIAKQSGGWGAKLGNLLRLNNYDAQAALNLMGAGIKGQLQTEINETNSPPLAAATIAAKGFDKPLIHSSHMWNSVDWEVKAA